jgi:hypothetical protein
MGQYLRQGITDANDASKIVLLGKKKKKNGKRKLPDA